MRVFLIHDPLRDDRRALYTHELIEQGITDAVIMPAVKTYGNVHKNISEAHKNCIRRAREEDLDSVVIMEDDVRFACPGAYNEFLRLSGELPEDWDLYTAGSYEYKAYHMTEPLTKLIRFSGLHCYMVHKRYYCKFLDTRGVSNLDKALIGNLWMSWPQHALQYDGLSSNTGKMTNYNTIFARKIKLWKPNE